MREIKFRAWDRLSNRIREVKDLITMSEYGLGVRFKDQTDEFDFTGSGYVNLMQYTGLKDKNGKEIYEGYIVREERGHSHTSVVEFRNGAFQLVHNHRGLNGEITGVYEQPLSFLVDPVEVIGDIYQNPELLMEA